MFYYFPFLVVLYLPKASARVLRKCGFHCEASHSCLWLKHGHLEDVCLFVKGRDLSGGRLPPPTATATIWPVVPLREDLLAMEYSAAAVAHLLHAGPHPAAPGLVLEQPLGAHSYATMSAALAVLEAYEWKVQQEKAQTEAVSDEAVAMIQAEAEAVAATEKETEAVAATDAETETPQATEAPTDTSTTPAADTTSRSAKAEGATSLVDESETAAAEAAAAGQCTASSTTARPTASSTAQQPVTIAEPTMPRPETLAAVLARMPRALFAYGTLRADFLPGGGDAWGVLPRGTVACYGRVYGFRLKQDLRARYPYAVHTGNRTDSVRGTLLTWPAADTLAGSADTEFYDRLQVCNLIEAHDPHGATPSLYERAETVVEDDGGGEQQAAEIARGDDGTADPQHVKAYIYHMLPSAERAEYSLDIPGGDWLLQVRTLRGDGAVDLPLPANE